jgi:hypothetical protein
MGVGMNRCVVALCALGVLTVVTPEARAQNKSRRMTADAVKAKNLTLQKVLDADLNGDGRKEVIGLCTGEKGVQLAVIGEDKEGAVVTYVAPPALGKEVAKVEVKALVPPQGSQQIILEVYDDTPDEKVKRVRVYGGEGPAEKLALKEIFSSKIERNKNKDDRPEWERDNSIVQYGDPRPGWYFEDVQEDGIVEVLVRRQPQIIAVKKDGGEQVKMITGVRERTWSWDTEKQKYVEGEDHLNDFLPAIEIAKVDASSVYIDPRDFKERKAAALSEALSSATAAGKDPKDLKDDVTIDMSDLIKLGADANLNTGWIEGNEKNDGKGEWLEVTLAEESEIHMVRVVTGCVADKGTFRQHNVPEVFKIKLGEGSEATVDRRKKGNFDAPVIAFTDDLIKMPDRPWAKTTLVFFEGKTETKKVRITLDKALKQGSKNRTCISEVSVH